MSADVDHNSWAVPRIGELAHQSFRVAAPDVLACLERQATANARLGRLLVDRGCLTIEHLDLLLAQQVAWIANRVNERMPTTMFPSHVPLSICLIDDQSTSPMIDDLSGIMKALRESFDEIEFLMLPSDRIAVTPQAVTAFEQGGGRWLDAPPAGQRKLTALLKQATGDHVVVARSDAIESLLHLPRLLMHARQADVVFAYRQASCSRRQPATAVSSLSWATRSAAGLRGRRLQYDLLMLPRWIIEQWDESSVVVPHFAELYARLARCGASCCEVAIGAPNRSNFTAWNAARERWQGWWSSTSARRGPSSRLTRPPCPPAPEGLLDTEATPAFTTNR